MMNDKLPHIISQSFPQLENAQFLRRFASPVPLVPDTTFDIYVNDSGSHLVFVTTDYIDLESQRKELMDVSGANEFKILSIVKPFNAMSDTIDITTIDDYDNDWFVKSAEGNTHSNYYYLATIEPKS